MSLRGENKRISNTVGSRKMSVISVFKPSLKEESGHYTVQEMSGECAKPRKPDSEENKTDD